jgi:hypothetical protein
LVKGGEGLSEGFEGESNAEERPELASVGLGDAGGVEGAEGGEEDDEEIEGVGEEEAVCGVVNGDEVKEEERRYEEGEGDEELGELAKGKQANLKGRAWRSVPSSGAAIRASVHQRSVKGRGMFTKSQERCETLDKARGPRRRRP